MTKRRFELVEGASSKFWEIEEAGTDLHVAWGRIGTAGQSQTKSFDDEAAAKNAATKLIQQKTGKGYTEIAEAKPAAQRGGTENAAAPSNRGGTENAAAPSNAPEAPPEADTLPVSRVPPRTPPTRAARSPAFDAASLYGQIRKTLHAVDVASYPQVAGVRKRFDAKTLPERFDVAALAHLDPHYHVEKNGENVRVIDWAYGLAFALGGPRGAAHAIVERARLYDSLGDFWLHDEPAFLATLSAKDVAAMAEAARTTSEGAPLRVRAALAYLFDDLERAPTLFLELCAADDPAWAIYLATLLGDVERVDDVVRRFSTKKLRDVVRALDTALVIERFGAAAGRWYGERFGQHPNKYLVQHVVAADSPEAARFFAAHLDHKLVAKEAARFFGKHPDWARAALAPVGAGRTKASEPAALLLRQLGLAPKAAIDAAPSAANVAVADPNELPEWLRAPRWKNRKAAPKKAKAGGALEPVAVAASFDAAWRARSMQVPPYHAEDTSNEKVVLLGRVSQLPVPDAAKKRFGDRAFWFVPIAHADDITLFDRIPERGGSGAQADAIMELLQAQVDEHSDLLQTLVGTTPELEFGFHASAGWDDVKASFEGDGFRAQLAQAWPPATGARSRVVVARPEGDLRLLPLFEDTFASGWRAGTQVARGGASRIETRSDGSGTMTFLGQLAHIFDTMSDEALIALVPRLPGGSGDEHTARYLVARFLGGPHEQAALEGAVHLARTDALETLEEDGVVSVHLALPLARLLLGKRTPAFAKRWLLAHPEHAVAGLVPAAFGSDAQAALTGLRLVAERDRDRVLELAARHGEPARAALAEEIARDPFDDVPSKLPTLPRFAEPSLHPPLLLRASGHALPDEAATSLLTMIAFSRDDAPYAGVRAARELLEPRSADAFAWSLFTAWEAGGRDGSDWVLRAVGALGGDECARKLTPKIRGWPGESAHAAAVKGLDALAAIGSDVSLMYLNGIAQKLKFKALQEKARQKIEEIAATRGLGAGELADRLVPDLDLDASGTRVLDFGPRQFRVVFDEVLKPLLTDDGQVLTDLPKPTKGDDQEKAKEAAEIWKALKADAKAIAQSEVLRLEQIMCMQRRIPAAVFRTFFVDHPLVTHLARRLVWGVYEDGRLTRCFRVTEDRTLADAGDATFALAEDAAVGVVHRLELDALDRGATTAKLSQLFSDYELLPPFDQLSRTTYPLSPAENAGSEVKRPFEAETGSVLGLEHRGWRKGPAEDGGWVMRMEKPLPGGLVAVLPLNEGGRDGGICMGWMQGTPAVQALVGVRLVAKKRDVQPTFGELGEVLASELIRDVEQLRS